MSNILNDFIFSSYITSQDTFFDELLKKRPNDQFEISDNNLNVLFNIIIEELDFSNNIFFTGQQIKATHFDIKNGIFIFSGIINNEDTSMIELIRNSIKNRSSNQFIKQIKITKGFLNTNNEIQVEREFSFKGFISDFFEFYDNSNNFSFEFVLCRRKILYRDDIFIKRLDNGILAIGKVLEHAKITIPITKDKKIYQQKSEKGKLQVGNTFWAISGIALAVLGVAGTVASGGTAAIALTILFGANTIVSNTYSIYLDFNNRDDEMDLDKLYNNPLKFSMGELFAIRGERNRKLGHATYYGTEIFLGTKGLKDLAKGFKVKSLFKTRNIFIKHSVFGKLKGQEQVLMLEKVLFNGYQVVSGVKGLQNNTQEFNESIKEDELPTYKATLQLD